MLIALLIEFDGLDPADQTDFLGKMTPGKSIGRVVFLVFEPYPFLLADMAQGYAILILLVAKPAYGECSIFHHFFTIPLMIAQPLR